MTSALQKFVKAFVDNRGKIAIVPSEGHVAGIFVPLEQALIEKLSAAAKPMKGEHLVEEIARTLALGSSDQASITVPRNMAAMAYAFLAFVGEPQTDSHKKLLRELLLDLFSRSGAKES